MNGAAPPTPRRYGCQPPRSFWTRAKQYTRAHAAARLSHPNIVAVFDSGADIGQHYLVMEYVPARAWPSCFTARAGWHPGEPPSWLWRCARPWAAAHVQGLVHRDVKPANVLVGPDGQAKVTDFGIAKAAAATTLTGTGTVLGTAAYLSPEQAQGGPVDARSDLYSLGCVLYELLCGTPPFGSGADRSPVAVATRHPSEPPEPPSTRNPQVASALDAVVPHWPRTPPSATRAPSSCRTPWSRCWPGRPWRPDGASRRRPCPPSRSPTCPPGPGLPPAGSIRRHPDPRRDRVRWWVRGQGGGR